MIGKSGKVPGKMTKNTNVENTCRVCGNRGSYSLYQVIPGYLHESEREFLNWGKPINHYLTFVLNQQVRTSFSVFILGKITFCMFFCRYHRPMDTHKRCVRCVLAI